MEDGWSLLGSTHDDAATQCLCAHGVKHFLYVCSFVKLKEDEHVLYHFTQVVNSVTWTFYCLAYSSSCHINHCLVILLTEKFTK